MGSNAGIILIVEDEALLALELQSEVEDFTGLATECVPSIARALALLNQNIGFAPLDINVLDGETFDLARRLREQHVPFVFTSGFIQKHFPSDLQQSVFISKPYAPATIKQVLREHGFGQASE